MCGVPTVAAGIPPMRTFGTPGGPITPGWPVGSPTSRCWRHHFSRLAGSRPVGLHTILSSSRARTRRLSIPEAYSIDPDHGRLDGARSHPLHVGGAAAFELRGGAGQAELAARLDVTRHSPPVDGDPSLVALSVI